jgi:hypothetical protein
MLAKRIRDVFANGQRIEERRALKHVAHPASQRKQRLLREVLDVAPEDAQPSGIRTDQTRDQAEKDRLAGAAAAHDDQGLALGQIERHAAKHFVRLEVLSQIGRLDDRVGHAVSRRVSGRAW